MIKVHRGDMEAVAALTGHSNVQVLLQTYWHVFEAVRGGTPVAERAALIDAAFS
jgi:hypothetical protein